MVGHVIQGKVWGRKARNFIPTKYKILKSVYVLIIPLLNRSSEFSNEIYVLTKLTRNKNARHMFLHHFFPEAMIGIICLYMHFILYTLHTRYIFFKYLHYFRSYDHYYTKCTCTSCAPTMRLLDPKHWF